MIRTADRIEAAVSAAVVMMSLLALPIAGAVGTAVYDSPAAAQGSAPAKAVAVGLAVWAGALLTAATVLAVTRALCNRGRRARWDSGLDALADHGGGPARQQP